MYGSQCLCSAFQNFPSQRFVVDVFIRCFYLKKKKNGFNRNGHVKSGEKMYKIELYLEFAVRAPALPPKPHTNV